MSFPTGKLPSVLKIAKVIPTHKNQSKFDYTNYKPISPYLKLKRSLKNSFPKGYLIFQTSTMYILVAIWFSTKILNYSCSD